LLSDPIGSEDYIRLYEKWGFSKLEGLSFFAMFYQERARELVRVWLRSHENAENFVYPVGFLYRHCIELNIKAAVVRSSWFRDLNSKRKEKKFRTHSLAKLWRMLKPILSEFTSDEVMEPFEEQLLELERLDESSQGFRYPFSGFDHKTGKPGPLLEGQVGKSSGNLVLGSRRHGELAFSYGQRGARISRQPGLLGPRRRTLDLELHECFSRASLGARRTSVGLSQFNSTALSKAQNSGSVVRLDIGSPDSILFDNVNEAPFQFAVSFPKVVA
jgi:hypothetical protein